MSEEQQNARTGAVFVGRRVVEARYMTALEARNHGWHKRPLVLLFDDGTVVYASMDDEGNDGGALFGVDDAGETLTFGVL